MPLLLLRPGGRSIASSLPLDDTAEEDLGRAGAAIGDPRGCDKPGWCATQQLQTLFFGGDKIPSCFPKKKKKKA